MAKSAGLAGLPAFTASTAPIEDRIHWLKVPMDAVEALYDQNILKVQRNHLRRALVADHLTKTSIPLHANFLAVRTSDGALQLIDGYTRITTIREGKKARPDNVWLGVVDVDNPKQVEQMYLAVDSRRAVKTGRDAFEEGLRKAGLLGKLTSQVFINGYAVSAVMAASGEPDTLTAVVKLKKAIERLDPLKLEVGRFAVPAGALAACLLIAQHEGDDEDSSVLQFTAAVSRPDHLTAADKKLVPGAVKFSAWLHEKREQGALSGKNVPVIMQQALGSYLWQKGKATGRIEPVARDEYLASLEAKG
jgi:hypothetical protein